MEISNFAKILQLKYFFCIFEYIYSENCCHNGLLKIFSEENEHMIKTIKHYHAPPRPG